MKEKDLRKLEEVYEDSWKKNKPIYYSREFIQFLKDEVERKNWFEKLCGFSGRVLKIGMNEEKRKRLQRELDFCNLDVKPSSVYSACIMSLIATVTIVLLMVVFSSIILPYIGISVSILPYVLLISILGGGFSFYVLIYPHMLVKKIRVNASSELVLAILYMAIGLKHIPNLENAVTFAAVNLKGPLGKDLRKLLWDIQTGKYNNIEDGLHDFSVKWKTENQEFSESIDLLRASIMRPGKAGRDAVDQAVTVILEGNKTRMESYARQLKNPISIIHALGILLPVITLILFPIVAILLPGVMQTYLLVVAYDIILPVVIFVFMKNILDKRPYSFSSTDITEHPKASKKGWFAFEINNKKYQVPLLPITLFLIGIISLPGILTLTGPSKIGMTTRIFAGLSILWSIIIGSIFYTFLSSKNNRKIKKEVEEVEREFGNSIFILGTLLGSGQPFETCLEKLTKKIKDQKIYGLFSRILYTVQTMGVTLNEAIFNKDFGIIKYYPSRLIKNILRIIVESTTKGMMITASTLVAVSEYLKNVRQVNEHLKEILEETTSSMKLLSSILVPLTCGIVLGMSSILIMLLAYIAGIFTTLPTTEETGSIPFFGEITLDKIMPMEIFIIVVGVYMIEMLVMLSIFTVRLDHGEDWIEMEYTIAINLIRGGVIFTAVFLLIYFVFGGLIPLG